MRAFWWWMVVMLVVVGVLLVLSGCGGLCGYHGSGCTEVDKTYLGVKEVLNRGR